MYFSLSVNRSLAVLFLERQALQGDLVRGDPQIGTEDHPILGPRTPVKYHRAGQLVRTAAFLQAGLQVEVVRTQQGPIRIKKDIQSQRRNRQAQSQGAFQMALNQLRPPGD